MTQPAAARCRPNGFRTGRMARKAAWLRTEPGKTVEPYRCECGLWHLRTTTVIAPMPPHAPSAPRTRPNTPPRTAGTTPRAPGPHSPVTGTRPTTDTDTNTGD
jgi:hypothetical protein